MMLIGRIIRLFVVGFVGAVIAAAILLFVLMPRLQWNATVRPSSEEAWVARYILRKWVRSNAGEVSNPVHPTNENLREGHREYDEHCAVCHGLDGSGQNRVGGDFYPPIVPLRQGLRFLSDGAFYFIVSNGIRMTAMPGFGPKHSADDLWKIILWVRHFPDLSPQERATIQAQSKEEAGGEAGH